MTGSDSARLVVLLLLTAATIVCGCALPRVPVRQVFQRQKSFAARGMNFHIYAAAPFETHGPAAALTSREYLPVAVYAVTDANDSIGRLFVGAWQEYLWRFSERLAPVDKEYFVPLLGALTRRGDSLVVTWLYPSVDARDDDLRQITPYRNSYWSVESIAPGGPAMEIFSGRLESRPQFGAYDARARFEASGAYRVGLPDSTEAMNALRRVVHRIALGEE